MRKWGAAMTRTWAAGQYSSSALNSGPMFWVTSEPSGPCIMGQQSVLCSAVSTSECVTQSVFHGSMKETRHQMSGLEEMTL